MQTTSKNVNTEILDILVNNSGSKQNKGGLNAYLIGSLIIGGIFTLAFVLNHLGLLKEV